MYRPALDCITGGDTRGTCDIHADAPRLMRFVRERPIDRRRGSSRSADQPARARTAELELQPLGSADGRVRLVLRDMLPRSATCCNPLLHVATHPHCRSTTSVPDHALSGTPGEGCPSRRRSLALVGTATEWERRKVGMTQAQDSGAARLAPAVLIAQHPLGAPMQASWYQVSGIECSPTYRERSGPTL